MTSAQQLVLEARDEALEAVNRNADEWDKQVVDAAILAVAATGRAFSANTFRDLLPEISNRNLIGARCAALAQRKPPPFVKVGEERSTDVGTHAKKINVYRSHLDRLEQHETQR